MLTIFFVISILNFNVFTMITNSKIIKRSQNLILIIRILIDLFFLMMISIIKIIITISSNSNSHKLFKNNNVRYLKFVDFYKSSAKTQTSFLSRIKINLVNRTQTSTIMITEIRLNLTIMDFKGDSFLLKHISIMSKIKKTSY